MLPESIPCHDPATDEALGQVPSLSPDDVRDAVARARAAQRQWAKTSFSARRKVLRRLLEYILEHDNELCEAISRDAGKTLHNALIGEIWPVCEQLRWTLANGERHLRSEPVSPGLLVHKRARIEYHPLGVIGVICPWNVPMQNILATSIPALFAGNAVVAKVSEWVAWSAARFAEMMRDVLTSCGHSAELVQIIVGRGDTGAALVSSGVNKIIFTGSVANGRRVLAESANTLTPVVLELGGKDPLIVCDDAALEQAAHAAVSGSFIHAGQTCLAAERVMVFDAVHDEFVERVATLARGLRQGPPLSGAWVDVGAMTTPNQVDIVESLVDDAKERGATVVVGGRRRTGDGGQFFEPTVLTGVTPEMRIFSEETFGPVLSIIRVADEEEAIALANSTGFGLSSSVFTRDKTRGRTIARQLRAGSTCVNDWAVMYMANDLPFGGVDNSGFGRLNGREGLRACCNVKAVLEDRLPIHRAVKMFPGKEGDYEFVRASVQLLYRRRWSAKFAALGDLVRGWWRRKRR